MLGSPYNYSKSEVEISLYDITQFMLQNWKKFLLACIIGAILGFGAWSFFGKYRAELIIINSTSSQGLDLFAWRAIQRNLPSIASKIYQDEKLSPDAKASYKMLSDSKWWSNDVKPTYAISKADAKDLAGISKNLEGASTTILGFTLYVDGATKTGSLENAIFAARFFKSGGAYLQIKSRLNAYEVDVIKSAADVQNEIALNEIQLAFLIDRLKSLEGLHKRFPSNMSNQQVIDPKDSSAKYLPLATQIIAVNSEIHLIKEGIIRLNYRLNQIDLLKKFLEEALPLVNSELDGIELLRSLLSIENKLRKDLPAADLNKKQLLDELRKELLIIETRFINGLDSSIEPITKKTGMIKATVGGLAIIGFLMLLFLLGKKLLTNQKNSVN